MKHHAKYEFLEFWVTNKMCVYNNSAMLFEAMSGIVIW
jgi:hypothetical protein